jgi:hypothetical protein
MTAAPDDRPEPVDRREETAADRETVWLEEARYAGWPEVEEDDRA